MSSPIEQFTMTPINVILIMLISTLLIIRVLSSIKYRVIIRSVEEIGKIGKEIIGISNYSPIIISLILYILINNIIGLIPYSYTTTSQLINNITLSIIIILGITIKGIMKKGIRFFNIFVPSGLSEGKLKYILPLVVSIEIISYISRIISLSVRLTANMLAGHILLNLISTYGYMLVKNYIIFLGIPIIILIPFILLEFGIALIQAYVFGVLTSTYIKDCYVSH